MKNVNLEKGLDRYFYQGYIHSNIHCSKLNINYNIIELLEDPLYRIFNRRMFKFNNYAC